MNFLQAIAREEGFYVNGTRPARNNNPGDLEFHDWMTQFGAVREQPPHDRFAVFPTPQQGFAAMQHLFGFPLYKGKTVEAALNEWAPPVENATNSYIHNVCIWVGCQPTDVIDDLLPGDHA